MNTHSFYSKPKPAHLALVFLSLVFAALACGEPLDPGTQTPRILDSTDKNPPLVGIDGLGPKVDPIGPAPVATLCMPHAVAYDTSAIPQLPAQLLQGLCNAGSGSVVDPNGPSTVYTYDAASRIATMTSQQSSGWQQTDATFELDEALRVRKVHTKGEGGFYVVEYGTTDYTFDEAGHLIHKLAETASERDGAPTTAIEKWQTWDGDRLMNRTEIDRLTGELRHLWDWTYDAQGRLLRARFERPEDGFVQDVLWAYNKDGHPLWVERRVRGELTEMQSWSWQGDRLVGRSYQGYGPGFLADSLGLPEENANDFATVPGLDSMELQPTDWMTGDDWATSALVVNEGESCVNLPRGRAHGYPLAEGLYELGAPLGERPSGIGFAYGYGGYGWYYGDEAWYGHAGVGTELAGIDLPWDRHLSTAIAYDKEGRMTRENLVLTGIDGNVQTLERTRTFSEHHINDLLMGGDANTSVHRTIDFDLDQNGHLLRRQLSEGDQVLEVQTSTYDDAGRLLTHDIELEAEGMPLDLWGLIASYRMGSGSGMTHIFWNYDEQGRVVERGTDNGQHETLQYDEQGRLVSTDGQFLALGTTYGLTHYLYDDQGRLVSQCQVNEASPTYCTTSEYDEFGQLIHREQSSSDGNVWVLEQNQYVCR